MSDPSTKHTTCVCDDPSSTSSAGEDKLASNKSATAAAPHMQILDELEDKARRCCGSEAISTDTLKGKTDTTDHEGTNEEQAGDPPGEWTLADDARLATFVQELTSHITARAESIADAVVALENKKDRAATKVELAKSSFLRLPDQRYVEQVVVDGTGAAGDGESFGATEPSRQGDGDNDEPDTPDTDQDAINQQKSLEDQAIRNGMKALELFYDPAHATGTEDHYFGLDQGDDSACYYDSAPADNFNQRPLPYVVGSREFMESTDAGLGEEYGADEVEDDVDGATDGSQVGIGG
eukprot:CAMPEP_0181032770 /NCGR_PEP_ID=MMETSP1070-20121207/6909_1 /TAXON_ID=265543 /ORGANISM="Minutocellus polymorphus, Strain NH13" /LENGTH=294 /DNA_ID=CAMNT_0023110169 /DNA_START=74 /DNA_END=955 /DNA_ORIENTATION=-